MKSATTWAGLGIVLWTLSATPAFAQRVRFASMPSDGSTVTIAQAPADSPAAAPPGSPSSGPDGALPSPSTGATGMTPPAGPGGSTGSGSTPPTFATPPAIPSSTPPQTYATPPAAPLGGNAPPPDASPAPSTYGGGVPPGYVPPTPSPYGGGPAVVPSYAPGPVPTATLGATIAPAPPGWDPYSAPASPYGPYGPSVAPGCPVPCVPIRPNCEYPWHAWAEFLYLRPRDTDVTYGLPINTSTGLPNGSTQTIDPDYTAAFRLGLSRALFDPGSSVGVEYTHFQSSADQSLSVLPPSGIQAQVLPGTPTFLADSAHDAVNFYLVDFEYRGLLVAGDRYRVDYLVGSRYANLTQIFDAQFSAAAARENLATEIDFNGLGLRVGLEAERYAARTGLMVYGRAAASFMAGQFRGYYNESNSVGTQLATDWTADRVVPILEIELGTGWVSPTGHFRLSGGYLFNAWYNVLRSSDFIQGVQANSFSASGSTITFDGLVLRAEARF